MEEITGYSASETVGRPVEEILVKLNRGSECRECESPLVAAGSTDRHCTLETKDGRLRCVLHRSAVLGDRIIQTMVDVSFLKDAEPHKPIHERVRFHGLVGQSHVMQRLYRQIELAADSNATVLITGPTGSGKELVAEAIHLQSARSNGPLVKVNCAALSESILESELFGHVEGAFTGAVKNKVGRFELADKGTIFLDEVGEISPKIQIKLLRFLQEKEFERVGESVPRKVDVRVVAATNKDLKELVKKGAFRQDLYFRLKVFPIETPPLRAHKEDLGLLAKHFIDHFNEETGKKITGFDPEAWQAVMDYCWPGNVREFQNAVEHAFVMRSEGKIGLFDLPIEIRKVEMRLESCEDLRTAPSGRNREELLRLLEESGWNMAEVGRRLGINRSSVLRRVRALGLPTRPPSGGER